MGFWSEYDPRSGVAYDTDPRPGVVFDEIDDAINKALGATGGAKGPSAPPPPPPLPAGFVPSPTPGRGVSTDGFTAIQLNPQTNQWQPVTGFAPSAAERQAAGVTRPAAASGGSGTNYAAQPRPGDQTKEALLAAGGKALGNNTIIMPSLDRYSMGTNGYFGPFGRAQPADMAALARQVAGITPQASTTTSSSPKSIDPLAPHTQGAGGQGLAQLSGIPGSGVLAPYQGATIPGMGAFNNPGLGISGEGRQTLYTGNGLNSLITGSQGSMSQIPVTPGFRGPGQTGNSIAFASGSSGGGRAEPQNLIPSAALSVPGTYVQGQGNANDSNRGYSVPFNIGQGGASLANIAGNNVQVNSADKSVGMGFALNAMPSSNIFAATNRQGSNDPATQAIQTLQLQAAIDQGMALRDTNPNQFGGFHAGTGNNPNSGNGGMAQDVLPGFTTPTQAPANYDWIFNQDDQNSGGYDSGGGTRAFASGGRIAIDPLARYASGGSMVTNEPIVGVGVYSRKPRFIVGEDNADPNRAPNAELLQFQPNGINVTPLQPPKAFAAGGIIQTQPPPGGTPDTATATVDPLDPNILKPWQDAQQRLQRQDYMRKTVDDPRRRAAGLGASTAVSVFEGDTPANDLGAGAYYDQSAQVNRMLGNILEARNTLNDLGAMEDPSQYIGQIAGLEQSQQPFKQAMGFQTQLQGLGVVGDPTAISMQIAQLDNSLGPVQDLIKARHEMDAIGNWHDPNELLRDISQYEAALEANNLPQALGGKLYNKIVTHQQLTPGEWEQYNNASQWAVATSGGASLQHLQGNLTLARSMLQNVLNHNAQRESVLERVANLQNNLGIGPEQINSVVANYQTQRDSLEQQYKGAVQAQQIRQSIDALAGPGIDPTVRFAEIEGQINPLRQLQAGVESRNQGRLTAAERVRNLARIQVPSLSAPVKAIDPLAQAARAA